jgi:periplasmic protein CpxP/Spy
MKSKFSPRLIVATIALSLGLAANSFAMPGGDAPNSPFSGMHQRRMDHGMKEMSRLHDELKLDAKQESLWKEAEKAGKDSMAGMHERGQKHHEEMKSLLNQPGADLRAIAKRMDEFRAEGQKLHEANRERWLAVYDSLNAEQKEKARLFFMARLDRMEQFSHRGGHGRHDGRSK